MSTRIPTRQKHGFAQMEKLQQDLQELLEKARPYTQQGHVPDGTTQKKTNPHWLGMTVVSTGGKEIAVGDVQVRFPLQSISKVFALVQAMMDRGREEVFRYVGMEPSGGPVDALPTVWPTSWPCPTIGVQKPANPLINSGAMVVSTLIQGQNVQEKLDRLLRLIRVISGNPTIRINEKVYLSEKKKHHRNRAIAHLLREQGWLEMEVDETLDLFWRQNAIEVTCRDLAYMATCLANGGTVWGLGKPVIPRDVVRVVTALMVTCGMYDASGRFAVQVGLPAKSSASGGILAFVPGKYGIGVYGPALDEQGHSLAGLQLLTSCVNQWGWSLF